MDGHKSPEPIKFGTDGIRGVAGEYPLDPNTIICIGRAIGRWLKRDRPAFEDEYVALIGLDTRQSGPQIAEGLAIGLRAEDISPGIVGVVTTPEMAYITKAAPARPIGIMITASHNPYQQNGIKLFDTDGFKLSDAAETAIERILAEETFDPPQAFDSTSAQFPAVITDILHVDYVQSLLNGIRGGVLAGLTVVLDCANGAAYEVAEAALQLAGALTLTINASPDGQNINRQAGSEHVRRDRSALLSAMRADNADLGLAFDGDADRVVFITPDGILLDGDTTLGILAVRMKAARELPGDTVVATDMSNSGLEMYLRRHKIKLERVKVGDRYVMARMRAGGFALGGEQAGHIIVLDGQRTIGDGIHIALRMAQLAALRKRAGKSLSELAAQIPRYPQVIASAQLLGRIDLDAVPGLADQRAEVLKAFGGDGRASLRFSGTEPNLLRAMVEGGPTNTLVEVAQHARALCWTVGAAVGTSNMPIDLVDCMTGAPVL